MPGIREVFMWLWGKLEVSLIVRILAVKIMSSGRLHSSG